ncbi:MAG: hypothetical protein LC118_18595 [Dehalococcoidia bacterium]|nr:hypothetical protein [Dehalococcoidia bacterium]
MCETRAYGACVVTPAIVWVALLAPFVVWPPIVVVIMRKMKDDSPGTPSLRSRSEAVIATTLVDGRLERCGATIILALGPAARLQGRKPAVVCISNLGEPRGPHHALGVCGMAEEH